MRFRKGPACGKGANNVLSRRHAEAGSVAVEFSLIVPLVFALLGVAFMVAWSLLNIALLDRAAEIIAREVAIDGDHTRAQVEAEASTPLIGITAVEVTDTATGSSLTGTPAAGQTFTVSVSTSIANPTVPLVRAITGGTGTGTTLDLVGTARGLGQ